MLKVINRHGFELFKVMLQAGDGFHGHWTDVEICSFLKKENEKKNEAFQKGFLRDPKYANKNWNRPIRIKELRTGSVEEYLESLTQKGFLDITHGVGVIRYQPSFLLREHIEKVCFGGYASIDPFTPNFKNDWQKSIVRNYMRYCYQQAHSGNKYPQYPTLKDVMDFFQVSKTDAKKGIDQLLAEGSLKIKDTGMEGAKKYEYVSNLIPKTSDLNPLEFPEILATPTDNGVKEDNLTKTLKTAVKQHLKDLPPKIKRASKTHQKSHGNHIQDFADVVGKKTKPEDITKESVQNFFTHISPDYAESTMHSIYTSVKRFLVWLRKEELSDLLMPSKEEIGLCYKKITQPDPIKLDEPNGVAVPYQEPISDQEVASVTESIDVDAILKDLEALDVAPKKMKPKPVVMPLTSFPITFTSAPDVKAPITFAPAVKVVTPGKKSKQFEDMPTQLILPLSLKTQKTLWYLGQGSSDSYEEIALRDLEYRLKEHLKLVQEVIADAERAGGFRSIRR